MSPGLTMLFIRALIFFAQFLQWMIFARAVVSWVRLSRENVIINFIFIVTEPVLKPIRDLLSKSPLGRSGNPIDLSPIIAFVLLTWVVIPLFRGALHSMLV